MAAAASPVSPKFVLVKWVYIIQEEDSNEVKMRCFDVSKVYDEESCYLCLEDFPWPCDYLDYDKL